MQPRNDAEAATVTDGQLQRFVAFSIDGEEYAVPIAAVTEVVPSMDIVPVPGAPEYILGLINLRGKVVPVLDLAKKFRITRQTPDTRQHIMIAENVQQVLFGILVDQVTEVLKIAPDDIKPAPEALTTNISAEYVTGVLVLGGETSNHTDQPEHDTQPDQERILLVMDLQKILSDANMQEIKAAQAGANPDASDGGAPPTNEGGTS